MIIFNLDGVLADCEHRKHFIDRLLDHPDYYRNPCTTCNDGSHHKIDPQFHKETHQIWEPDCKSYEEACDKDESIKSCIYLLEYIGEGLEYGSDTPRVDYDRVQIWTGRCESQRKKTEKWLSKNLRYFHEDMPVLKMRPIGNNELECDLKERWLHEYMTNLWPKLEKFGNDSMDGFTYKRNDPIQMVFESDPDSIDMYRRHGIFVFDCRQKD